MVILFPVLITVYWSFPLPCGSGVSRLRVICLVLPEMCFYMLVINLVCDTCYMILSIIPIREVKRFWILKSYKKEEKKKHRKREGSGFRHVRRRMFM